MPGFVARRASAVLSAAAIAFSALTAIVAAPGAEAAGTPKEVMRPVTAAAGGQQREAPRQDDAARAGGPERHAAALPGRRSSGLAAAPACLPDRLKATLLQIEQKWGPVEIISAHRPGARIRGSGKPSLHASCRAVDFHPPKGTYRAVATWLKKTHAGGVGTYSGKHNHIHIDARPCKPAKCYRWHN